MNFLYRFLFRFAGYDEPPREEFAPEQRSAPPESYSTRHLYDTPYEEERRGRAEITETVTVEHRTTVESSPPRGESETGYVAGRREEVEESLPVLKDPDYRLPPGYQEKPAEKKPVNSIKCVFIIITIPIKARFYQNVILSLSLSFFASFFLHHHRRIQVQGL